MVVSSSDDTGVPHTFAVSRSRWSDGLAFGGFTVSLVDLSRLREWSEEQGRVSASTVVLILADGTVVAWLAKGGPGNPSDGEEMRRILASHLNSESIAENGEVGADRSTFAEDAVIGIGLARDFPFIGIVLTRTADVLVGLAAPA